MAPAGAWGRRCCGLSPSSRNVTHWAAAVDPRGDGETVLQSFDAAPQADIIIDFSHHSAVTELLAYAQAVNTPVIVATTGHTPEERALIEAAGKKIPVFYSGNMSLGIALLCSLAKKTAAVFPDAGY